MNKRNMIIVSIVGITIVLLALLGITYAYYLTRIEGNTNTNSISVTTADLKLVYGDGTTQILTKENIVPDNNNPVGTKDFSVTNTGNTTIGNYSVVLEYAVIDGIKPSVFVRPQDFEFTLTCVDNEGNACNGTKVNFNNEALTLTTSSIEPNEVHNYTLTIFYVDPGVNQSDDMGKNLNLKVQIYEVKETVDIKGTITGADENYSVKLTSNPKVSPIVKNTDGSYSYAFSGIEIGTHTLRVLNKDGVEVSNQKIVIQKGDSIGFSTTTIDSVTVPLIIVNEENRVISLTTNVNTVDSTISNSGTSISIFNPYESNKSSLAYNILNNSQIGTNGTLYRENPITTPGRGSGNIVYTSISDPTSYSNTTYYTSKWYVYSNSYKIDVDGYFTLIDPQIGLFTDVASDMIGKYVLEYSGYSTEEKANNYINKESEVMYKIGDLTTISKLYYASVTKVSENTENILTKTFDDYGISYYYRGGVTDNYLNFAGMCWRIVRIKGDGSTKLILEDSDNTCQTSNGNWQIPTTVGGTIYKGYFGYSLKSGNPIINYLNPAKNPSSSMVNVFKNFQSTFDATNLSKMQAGDWCLNNKAYNNIEGEIEIDSTAVNSNYSNSTAHWYDTLVRINKTKPEISLKCPVDTITTYNDNSLMYVGALTVDEIINVGYSADLGHNLYTYLTNENVDDEYVDWYTLSPHTFNNYFDLGPGFTMSGDWADNIYLYDGNNNCLSINSIDNGSWSFRPVINLKSGITISSGNGIKSNPYVIE